MSLTVLITGGTGFIGSNLAKAYLKQNAEVHLIVREESSLTPISDLKEALHFHKYDGQFQSLDSVFQKVKPNFVFHLASLYITEHQPNDIVNLIQSNITFGTHLAEAMVKNGVTNLVNTGTSWQHFANDPYNPVNLYAATKEAYEKILTYYAEAHGLQYTTLKLFDTYGPNDHRKKLFYLLKSLENSQQALDMSPGEQLIDLVHIDDVLRAFMIAANGLQKGEVQHNSYAISSGNPIKLKELVNLYTEMTKKGLSINWGGRPYRNREVMNTWNKGEKLPGWEPVISLKDGIMSIINNN
jgi:nucleoside-diphosphate-sugar epimerase